MAIRERPSKTAKRGVVYEYYFTYKDQYGKTQRISKSGFATKREARNAEEDKRQEIKESNGDIRNKKILFDDAFQKYIQESKIKRSTKELYQQVYNRHLKKKLGGYAIFYIDDDLIQGILDSLDLANRSKNNLLSVINSTIRYSVRKKLIPSRKKIIYDFEEEHKKEKTPMSEETFNFILESFRNKKNGKQYSMIMQVGWYTGMRISEVLGLKVEDIDLDRNTININKQLIVYPNGEIAITSPKTSASVGELPIVPELREELIQYIDSWDKDFLFMKDNGNHITRKDVHNAIVNTGAKGSFHQLRHGVATRLKRAGVDAKIAQKILRHSSYKTTIDVYTHIEEQEMIKAMNDALKCVENVSNDIDVTKIN